MWSAAGCWAPDRCARLHGDVWFSDKLARLVCLDQDAAIPFHVTTRDYTFSCLELILLKAK